MKVVNRVEKMRMVGKIYIIVSKILKRASSVFKVVVWKMVYGNAFSVGYGTFFYPRTHIIIEKKGSIKIGDNCFFNNNCSINSMVKIEIGNDCIFGENVCIYDHNHQYMDSEKVIRKQQFNVEEIKIGDNCWIGSNVTILKGVTIGDNVVVGAGVIVYKSIPSNSIAIDRRNIDIRSIKEEV